MATEQEILNDIQHIYKKIDQCYAAKTDLSAQIDAERNDRQNLDNLIQEERDRLLQSKKSRYDIDALIANITRCEDNIKLFNETISRENENIAEFQRVVAVLQEDMKRPIELTIDMSTTPPTSNFRNAE